MTGTAPAQTGRVSGIVKDENGQGIKGATIAAENPDASPSSLTASADNKGRFAMIGLRSGLWRFTALSPGFTGEFREVQLRAGNTPSITFELKIDRAGAARARARVAAKDLQTDLQAADQLFTSKQWDEAIRKYQAILAKTASLSVIDLQIAQAYRNKADDLKRQDPGADANPLYDLAIGAYQALLKDNPGSDKAQVGIAMTNLAKGDLEAAEKSLDEAAQKANATTEVFYGLGEVKIARGKNDDAMKAYERAAQMDPHWGKPVFALGKIALAKGDKDRAVRYFEKVAAVDPISPEAAQSTSMVNQLTK